MQADNCVIYIRASQWNILENHTIFFFLAQQATVPKE